MTGTGWVRRAVSATATGTTDLTISLPTGAVDDDILLMGLSHKGAGYATVPVGWTLVAQNVSAAIRGELYWKRASGEPANYSVTGLATIARGVIVAYSGGLLVGDVVEVSSSAARAAATKLGAPTIVTVSEHALLFSLFASTASEASLFARTAADGSIGTPVPVDPNISSIQTIVDAKATGITLSLQDVIKVVPGDTGETYKTSNFTGDHVGIWAAFIPEPTVAGSGSRLYFTAKYPTTHLFGPLDGNWESTWQSPRGYGTLDFLWQLSETKTGGGQVTSTPEGCNRNSADADILYHRFCYGPLAAQTIAGTLDAMLLARIRYIDTFSPVPTGQFKVHAYITNGASTDVRAVLLNEYIDPALPGADFTGTFTGLTAPQALTSGDAEAGDYLMIEVGIHVTSAAYDSPIARPPTQYAMLYLTRNSAKPFSGSSFISTVGALDGTAGSTDTSLAPYLQFSQTLVLQAPAGAIPTNISCDTATVVAALPYTSGAIDTTRTPAVAREGWWTWTAPFTDRVFLHAWGTFYNTEIKVYESCPIGATSGDVVSNVTKQVFTSMSAVILDAVQGTTYFIRVRHEADARNAPASGGSLQFSIVRRQALANNDVLYGNSGYLARYTTDGVLADLSMDLNGFSISGLAIDYTQRPMDDLNGGLNATDRLYVALFGSDLVEILDLETLNVGELEIDFMNGGSAQNLASLTMNAAGLLVWGWFGNGFTRVCVTNSYLAEVSSVNAADLNVVDGTHAVNQAGAPWPAYEVDPTTLEAGGTNYVEYAPDGETVFYTSGGWYVPVGGQTVYRFHVPTQTQLGNFATVPVGPGPNPGVKGLFPLADGGCLVCNGAEVVRLNAAGAVAQTYTPVATNRVASLADVEITADGEHFWVLDEMSASLFKFNLATGAQEIDLWTGLGTGDSTSLVIYRHSLLRLTQLPLEVAYDYAGLRPYIRGGGLDWLTPPTP